MSGGEAHGRAGPWAIDYISLDDSTAAARKWDPVRCADNARPPRVEGRRGRLVFVRNVDPH